MTQKLKCHQNWNVTKTEMSPKPNVHNNENITKIYQDVNFTLTETSINLKFYQKLKYQQNQNNT